MQASKMSLDSDIHVKDLQTKYASFQEHFFKKEKQFEDCWTRSARNMIRG